MCCLCRSAWAFGGVHRACSVSSWAGDEFAGFGTWPAFHCEQKAARQRTANHHSKENQPLQQKRFAAHRPTSTAIRHGPAVWLTALALRHDVTCTWHRLSQICACPCAIIAIATSHWGDRVFGGGPVDKPMEKLQQAEVSGSAGGDTSESLALMAKQVAVAA